MGSFGSLPALPTIRKNSYASGFVSGALTEPTRPGGDMNFSFAFSDASDADGYKLRIVDGEINGEFPDGMGTSDTGNDYVLAIAAVGDVWAGFTYDTTTFEITSRFLDSGAEIPDSEFGTQYYRIGQTWLDSSATPPIFHFKNTHCGDIVFRPMITFENGVSKVSFIPVYGDSVEIVYP